VDAAVSGPEIPGQNGGQGQALVNLLYWMTHEGQKYAELMHFAPLSEAAVEKAEKLIQSISYGGKSMTK
jgi:phosphate transport system substrate-binding protein